jgi:hypothetical protein
MSVTETYEPVLLETDGEETDFDFDFSVFNDSDLVVALVDPDTLVATEQELGVDYTVTLNTSTVGGTVVFGEAPADEQLVSIQRDIPATQTTDIPSGGLFRESQIENALDKAVLLIQQLQEQVNRALLQNPYQEALDLVFPLPEAGSVIGWNEDGDALENVIPNTEAYITKASQAEAQAGVEDTKFMTAAKTKDAIDAQRILASQAEAEAGVDNTKFMSPLRTVQAIAIANEAESVNYGASSTIGGWSHFIGKAIWCKKIGNLVFVNFRIMGTSNSDLVEFTLPYAFSNYLPYLCGGEAQDNGVALTEPTLIVGVTGGSTCRVYKTLAAGAWTTSGTKLVSGQFFYETA